MRLRDLDLDDGMEDGAFPVTKDVESNIPHPKYKAGPLVNDIAVIKMKDRVKITGNKHFLFLTFNTSLPSDFSARMHSESYASVVQNIWDYNIFSIAKLH